MASPGPASEAGLRSDAGIHGVSRQAYPGPLLSRVTLLTKVLVKGDRAILADAICHGAFPSVRLFQILLSQPNWQ
jgi:hypothetical protein